MITYKYCPPCAPYVCQCGEDTPTCHVCGEAFPSVDAWESAAVCWSCGTDTCGDCIDAHGWPCSHFQADWQM